MKTYKNGKLMENVYIKGIKANGLIKNGVTFFKIGDEPSGDITSPVYTALRIMGGIRNTTDNTYYANSTHNVTIYVNFGEKLYTKPKVKIGNQEWELSSEAASGNGYMYYRPIPASSLDNGLVNFEVYGYADESGNVGRTLTNADITLSSQSRVIVDKVAPSLNFGNGSISESKLIKAIDDNFSYMTIKNVVSNATETIYENEYELSVENADNLRFDVTVYDKAGNVSPVRNFFIDNVSPKIVGTAILNEQEVSLENNGNYSSVNLKVSDGSLKSVVITKDSKEIVNEIFANNYNPSIVIKYENVFDEEGTYVVKATDRIGHENTLTFSIGKTLIYMANNYIEYAGAYVKSNGYSINNILWSNFDKYNGQSSSWYLAKIPIQPNTKYIYLGFQTANNPAYFFLEEDEITIIDGAPIKGEAEIITPVTAKYIVMSVSNSYIDTATLKIGIG